MNPTRTRILGKELEEISDWSKTLNIDVPMKILVNGASGFLGQWVYAVLHHSTTFLPNLEVVAQTSRLENLEANWSSVLAGSIKRFEKNSENFDVVFDFALPDTGPTTQEKINQSGQFYKNILKCAALVKPGGRIVHPSSGATYGDLRYTTRLCEDSTTSPLNLSIYGETKLGIENLSPTFQSAGIDFVTPRIFSVFGPLMREDSPLVGNTFLREAARGHKIEARQSVKVFRDFIFVSDLVKQLIQVGIEKTSIKNINLGSHNRLEIATFGKLVGSSAGVEFTEGLTQNPPDKYFGCLHHLELNHPELVRSCTSVTQGIDRTLAFYQAE